MLSPRLDSTHHSAQVLALHYLCSAPWDMENLRRGRGLSPLLLYPGVETQAVKVQQFTQMQQDQGLAWHALEVVAEQAGLNIVEATREVALAPWEYVAYQSSDSRTLHSQIGAELLQGVREYFI